MTKKGIGTRDHRQEPDSEGTGENYRVDRVFGARTPTPAAVAAAVPGVRRPTGRTVPPTVTAETADAELALRRQLSRLQRQLAEAQRELANKDEDLAREVERRLEVSTAAEALQRAHDELQVKVQELAEYYARTNGLEQRLQEAIASSDELTHQLERERAERTTLSTQFEEANAAFERARTLWKDESALVGEHHATELLHAEAQKRAALEALETQMNAALDRQREAHDAAIAELEAAHERSVGTLRGELEPKVAVARSLAEEIERLTSQLAAAKTEHVRDVTERTELHKWEMQQQTETHAAQLATEHRHHQSELAKRDEELEQKKQTLAQAERNAELREQLWEQTVSAVRESQKKLQQELAEAKEKFAQADASRASFEQRLTSTLAEKDKATDELEQVRKRLDAVESQARLNAMDRKRFAAYLEEGLALLGAIPAEPARGAETAPIKVPAADALDDDLHPIHDANTVQPGTGTIIDD